LLSLKHSNKKSLINMSLKKSNKQTLRTIIISALGSRVAP
jgi:hypothetical protein